jgi:hypothetical protein
MGVFKRIRKNKDGSKTAYWYTRMKVNGKDKWESVGKVGEVTKAVAQMKEDQTKRKIRRGIYEYEGNVALENIEEEYIEHVRDIKQNRTWKGEQEHLKTLKAFFKDKTIDKITPKDIDDYKTFRRKTVTPATVNRDLATLRHVFNLARRWKKFYGENPVSVAGLMTENNQRDRVLTPDEEERLMSSSSDHLKPILAAALNTG